MLSANKVLSAHKVTRCVVVLLLSATAFVGSSSARAEILVDMYPGGTFGAVPNQDYGFKFTLSQAQYITALGIWDEDGDGLLDTHAVGLWTTAGSLLATVSVDNGSTPVASADASGQWIFENLASPFILDPGTYILGADYAGGNDPVRSATSGLTVTPGAIFIEPRYSSSETPGLDFPDTVGFLSNSYFGPNLMLTAVPEPSSMLLVGLLTAGGGFRALRRRWAGRNDLA